MWRGFFARRIAARGETLCREEESEVDQNFVLRYVAMEVFSYMARRGVGDARETGNRVEGETDRPLPSHPGFGKNTKFTPSFANFTKMQNSNAKPLDTSF